MNRLAALPVLALIALMSAVACSAQMPTLISTGSVHPPGVEPAREWVVSSAILAEDRHVVVSAPTSFPAGSGRRAYPTILVLDAEANFWPTVTTVRWLADSGAIPEAFVVGVRNTDRTRDLTPPGISVSGSGSAAGGDRFLDFITRELLPAIARQYPIRGPQVMIGHSSGGLLATYASATRPADFPFVVSLDAPVHLQDGWLAHEMTTTASANDTAPRRYVSVEARFGWPDRLWHDLEQVAPDRWSIHRQRLESESHQSMVPMATYLGLQTVFQDYGRASVSAAPASTLIGHYDALPSEYGGPLLPPRALMQRLVDDFIIGGDYVAAAGTLSRLEEGYGLGPATEQLRARLRDARARGRSGPTVAELLSEPQADPDAMRAYLGTWHGTSETEGGPPAHEIVVRFLVVDGAVHGEIETHPAPGVVDVQNLPYLRVAGDSLYFANMNRMRPRGLLMYEGYFDDGVLRGEMRLRGVDFQMPSGRPLPVTRFELRRAR